MSERERGVFGVGLAVAIATALALAGSATSGHALDRALGGAAITLLLASLACSPIASLTAPAWSVALRAARRRLGITSSLVAVAHASVALPSYLVPLTLGPLATLAWLRHGALALAILVVLLATSFPRVHRVLRVRAWSALHRLAYVAALLASLHALAVPFGSARVGVAVLALTVVLLAVRTFTWGVRRRSRPAD